MMYLQLITMRMKCYFALLLLALAAAQSPSQQPIPTEGGDTMNEQMVESKQRSMIRQDFEQQFNPWVVEEIAATRQNERLQFVESFLLQLHPQEQHEFRWPIKTKQTELELKIRVFTHENGNDIVIIKNPDEDSRVQVSYRTHMQEQSTPLAYVYLAKIVKVRISGEGAFIQLRNTHNTRVIVEVSLQGEPARLNPEVIANNDNFKVPTIKMEAMLGEMRTTEANRKWQYKWEWGFLEREEHYEQEMLKLVGGETIIILATAIVQMYCIKALLENNNVV